MLPPSIPYPHPTLPPSCVQPPIPADSSPHVHPDPCPLVTPPLQTPAFSSPTSYPRTSYLLHPPPLPPYTLATTAPFLSVAPYLSFLPYQLAYPSPTSRPLPSAGVNRHFHMICIRDKFSQNIGRQVPSKVIWDHLSTMYDMQALVSWTPADRAAGREPPPHHLPCLCPPPPTHPGPGLRDLDTQDVPQVTSC